VSASTVGRRFGFAFCTSDATDVLADPEAQAVIIATRHDRHAQLVVAALQAGKSVFVEKPLALTRAEIDAVVAAQHVSGRHVFVGFNRRYAPLSRAVRQHFARRTEPLVVTVRVNAGFLSREHWTQDPVQGGGRILGEACHFVDLLAYLIDSPFVDVSAHSLPDKGRYSGDNVCATFRFQDSSVAMLTYLANGDAGLAKERIEVSGAGRSAVLDDFREARLYTGGRSRRISAHGQDKGHHAELAAFVDVLAGRPSAQWSFADSVASTLATIAVQESTVSEQPVAIDVGLLQRLEGSRE
jgi:predicted dehydrogenase